LKGAKAFVVGDSWNARYVGLSDVHILAKWSDGLAEHGAISRLAETHAEVRGMLRAEDLELKVGRVDCFTSVADAVAYFEAEKV
jgi:MFS superfamily sulfate permease-like transporter